MRADPSARRKTLDAGVPVGVQVHEDSQRIAELLEELRAMAGPVIWQRIEELVERLLGTYGTGLSRVLQHAADAGSVSPELIARLTRDELVSSLLLLHGLHPSPLADRLRHAVQTVTDRLALREGDIEVMEATQDAVRVRVARGSAAPTSAIAVAIRAAVEQHAPEVQQVLIDAEDAAPRPADLVHINLERSRKRA